MKRLGRSTSQSPSPRGPKEYIGSLSIISGSIGNWLSVSLQLATGGLPKRGSPHSIRAPLADLVVFAFSSNTFLLLVPFSRADAFEAGTNVEGFVKAGEPSGSRGGVFRASEITDVECSPHNNKNAT